MYSAFESWMVTEYHNRHLDLAGTSLSSMFGLMTTLNSVVAILSGVFSEWLVQITRTRRAPFMASASLLTIAFWFIFVCWVSLAFFFFATPHSTNVQIRVRTTEIVDKAKNPMSQPKMFSRLSSQTRKF